MIEIVQGGNLAFNALVFGGPDPSMQQYLANQYAPSMAGNLTEYGQNLYNQSRQLFERFSGDEAMRYIKAIGRAATAVWQTDCIRLLTQIGELQWAPPTMQRWIMAEPTTRKMFHEQRLDGFSHHYMDIEPDGVGADHYDYRRATQGLFQFDTTDAPDVPEYTATTYFDEVLEGDTELTLSEQVDIQNTWDSIRYYLKHGNEDPTDRFNSSLD